MVNPPSKSDIIWGYAAQSINLFSGLILLPVALIYLTTAEVGIWFVFITLGSFAQLLEFGFQPTIARNVTYIFSGVKSLKKEGLPNNFDLSSTVDIDLLSKLISTSRYIYKRVAFLSSVVLLLVGSVYVNSVLLGINDKLSVVIAWCLFALGNIFTFYYGYINALLQGRGDITQSNKVVIITKGGMVVLGTLSLIFGYGLLGLGVANLISAIIGRILALSYMVMDKHTESALKNASKTPTKELLKIIWHNSQKIAIVQICGFIVIKSSILIGTSFLGPSQMTSYSLTNSILITISGVSSLIFNLQIPHLTTLQLSNDLQKIRKIYISFNVLSILLFVLGAIFLGVFGSSMLTFIGSKVDMLPLPLFVICAFIYLLEMHHVIAATYITTLNNIPFLRPAVLSAFLIIFLSFLMIKPLGILGLVLAQGITQLLYNNWKWPWVVYQHLFKVNKCKLIL